MKTIAEFNTPEALNAKEISVVIGIGNTDNKLTQQEWSAFVDGIDGIAKFAGKVHFMGGSPNWMPWQNATWILEVWNNDLPILRKLLAEEAKRYRQDTIYLLAGEPEFITEN